MSEPHWPTSEDESWPGDGWPGYFSRSLLHRVEQANSERLARTLGLAECGAVAVRPQANSDYAWCKRCSMCFPEENP